MVDLLTLFRFPPPLSEPVEFVVVKLAERNDGIVRSLPAHAAAQAEIRRDDAALRMDRHNRRTVAQPHGPPSRVRRRWACSDICLLLVYLLQLMFRIAKQSRPTLAVSNLLRPTHRYRTRHSPKPITVSEFKSAHDASSGSRQACSVKGSLR